MTFIISEDQNTIVDDETQVKYISRPGTGRYLEDCPKCHFCSADYDSNEGCYTIPCCADERFDKEHKYFISLD